MSKALRLAGALSALLKEVGTPLTRVEALAYASVLAGIRCVEMDAWDDALDSLVTAHVALTEFLKSDDTTEAVSGLRLTPGTAFFLSETEPLLRFATYTLVSTMGLAEEEVAALRAHTEQQARAECQALIDYVPVVAEATVQGDDEVECLEDTDEAVTLSDAAMDGEEATEPQLNHAAAVAALITSSMQQPLEFLRHISADNLVLSPLAALSELIPPPYSPVALSAVSAALSVAAAACSRAQFRPLAARYDALAAADRAARLICSALRRGSPHKLLVASERAIAVLSIRLRLPTKPMFAALDAFVMPKSSPPPPPVIGAAAALHALALSRMHVAKVAKADSSALATSRAALEAARLRAVAATTAPAAPLTPEDAELASAFHAAGVALANAVAAVAVSEAVLLSQREAGQVDSLAFEVASVRIAPSCTTVLAVPPKPIVFDLAEGLMQPPSLAHRLPAKPVPVVAPSTSSQSRPTADVEADDGKKKKSWWRVGF
jgi:hypothetical protein